MKSNHGMQLKYLKKGASLKLGQESKKFKKTRLESCLILIIVRKKKKKGFKR